MIETHEGRSASGLATASRSGPASGIPGNTRVRVLWLVDGEVEGLSRAGSDALEGAGRERGIEVTLMALDPPRASEGSRPVRSLGASGPLDVAGFFRLLRLVRSGRFDLVHVHGPWAGLWGAIARRLGGVPLVATLQEFPSGPGQPEASRLRRLALWTLQRHVDRVIAISGAQWDRFVHDRLFPRALLEVVHPGIDPSTSVERSVALAARLRERAGFPRESIVAASVLSLDEGTGVDLLLWAMPDIVRAEPSMRFVLVGEGERRSELQRRVRARGMNRFVHWSDPEEDTRAILAGSDLLVHPSLRDPFPLIVLEAMATGLPVVATRVGSLPEILGSTRVGRLVPPTSSEALAEAVLSLVKHRETLLEMGHAARGRVEERFSHARWIREMDVVYRGVVREGRAGSSRRSWPNAGLDVELLALRRTAVPGRA